MAPVVNIPVMEHIVELLVSQGFGEIMVNLHYLPDLIEYHFRDGSRWGARIHYSKEKEPLGTAGGVKAVSSFFDETFLVIGGDDLTDVDLMKGVEFHRKSSALATIGLSRVEDPTQLGVVVADPEGRILSFQEKPLLAEAASLMANTGIYIFEPEIFKYIPPATFYDFGRQLFPLLLKKKAPFFSWEAAGYWCDIGSLAQYRQAHFDVLNRRVRVRIPGKTLKEGIRVEEGVEVHPKARITGPVLIGKNCRIGPDALIEGPAVLGEGVVLRKGATVKYSILWNGVRVGEEALLDHCLVDNDRRIESGRTCLHLVIASEEKSLPR
jgi:NDP-sugar pyrophosphorylase family protein